MAKKFKKMAKIAETEGSNFGNYDEANGGGSPKGGIWGGRDGRIGWGEREKQGEVKEGEHRQKQPRTRDGKFSYNSLNGKETKYDGRGKTVNPLLTGGVNGIKIDDVKAEFQSKSGSLYEKYKGKWYRKGAEKITKEGKKYVTKISAEDVWEIAKYSWDVQRGGFFGGQRGKTVAEEDVFAKSKPGRSTESEKAAKSLARKTGQEQFVTEADGAIKIKGEQAAKAFKKLSDKATGSQLKHSQAQIDAYRKAMEQQYGKEQVDKFTDEQIDAVIEG